MASKGILQKLIDNPGAIVKSTMPAGQKQISNGIRSDPTKKPRRVVERTDIALPDRNISMSNALARGAQGLSLAQKRIIALAMSKTDSMSQRDAQESAGGWCVRLTAAEYVDAYDVDPNTAYEQLQLGSRSLLKTLWRTVTPAAKGKGEVITEGQWLFLAEYRKKEGTVDISFHPKVAPHLLALRSHFVTYKLKQAAALRSIYAWRLFECIQSWRSRGIWQVEIDDFIKTMEAPISCGKDFRNLRVRVIEPAVAELVAKNSLKIEWDPVKAGRKVTGLVFRFAPDPQGKLDL